MTKYRFMLIPLILGFSCSISFAANSIHFQKACDEGDQIVISAVGDVLLHGVLQKRAAKYKDHKVLWKNFIPYFEQADISYANLEGPTATGVTRRRRVAKDPGHVFDNKVYTSYPLFNYHKSLVEDLMDSGIDIVSTANNHSLDRGSIGVNRTLDAIDELGDGLISSGTKKTGEDEDDRSWIAVTEQNGIRVGWLACTYGTNGMPDKKKQVLTCFRKSDRLKIKNLIKKYKSQLDAIIVTPHWGSEYTHRPSSQQKKFAKEMLDAGALAILGAHPHVLQPMEKYQTRDGRETFIIYSLGNFVSNQSQLPRRSSIVLFLGLTKNEKGTHLNGVKYLPSVMNGRGMSKELMPLKKSNYKKSAARHIQKIFSKEHELSFENRPGRISTNEQCF